MTPMEVIAEWIARDGSADPLALATALADPSAEVDDWLAAQEREGLFFLPSRFAPHGRVAVRRWLLLQAIGLDLFSDVDPDWVLPAESQEDRHALQSRFDRDAIGNDEFDILTRWLRHPALFSDEEALRRTWEQVGGSRQSNGSRWSFDCEVSLVLILVSRRAYADAFGRCLRLCEERPEKVDELRRALPAKELAALFGGPHSMEAVGRSPDDTAGVLSMARLFLAPSADPGAVDRCAELLAWAPTWDGCGAHCDLVGRLAEIHGAGALPGLAAAFVHGPSELDGVEAGDLIVRTCRADRNATLAALGGPHPAWCEPDPARVEGLREALD